MFHSFGTKNIEQHLFVCEAIWTAKKFKDKGTKIAQLESTFKDCVLKWYMKYKGAMPDGKNRTLVDIKKALFREFQNRM